MLDQWRAARIAFCTSVGHRRLIPLDKRQQSGGKLQKRPMEEVKTVAGDGLRWFFVG
jgi:hypothetical protein